jgi:hypothetical protein
MSLGRTVIVAFAVAGLVANIQVAGGADVPFKPRPAVERVSEPRRARQPDAAQELLYQQFREWLRKKQLDKSIRLDRDVELSALARLGTAKIPMPPMLPMPPPMFPMPPLPPIAPMPPLPPMFPLPPIFPSGE